MKRIGLLSDTHSFLDKDILNKYFKNVDEIWHAGDIGNLEDVTDIIKNTKPLRAVFGNIDNHVARAEFPLDNRFECEGFDVWITHIGGYPGRYNMRVRELLKQNSPDIFICGHSHILKVMRDKKHNNMLTINPGAAGVHGFHKMRTAMRFTLNNKKIENLEVIELGLRGKTKI
ncbi:MAG: metallophosphoesterase family protein [Chitinophagales bacterium]